MNRTRDTTGPAATSAARLAARPAATSGAPRLYGKRTATPERVTRVSAHIVTHETARGGLRLAAGVTV